MKACVHKTLTTIALQHCEDKLPKTISRFSDEILRGVVGEDDPSIPRILNWHFYRSNEKIASKYLLFAKQTSEDIFAKHIEKMNQYGENDKRRYNNLGRIIHHIQDMSTPSHVIPIFHGGKISDYFEEFMSKQANADALGEKVVLGNSQKNFNALYKDAAIATLEYIRTATFELKEVKTNGQKQTLYLNEFWQDPHQNEDPKFKGFGSYGSLHGCFLSTATDFCNCPSKIAKGELLKIHTYICNKAIQDTCDALFYAAALDNSLRDS